MYVVYAYRQYGALVVSMAGEDGGESKTEGTDAPKDIDMAPAPPPDATGMF